MDFLVWLLSLVSPAAAAIDAENARCAACVSVAYAVAATPTPPLPAPTPPAPKPGECCAECKGTGFVVHGDGHKTPCPCPPTCKCKASKCDGKCVIR